MDIFGLLTSLNLISLIAFLITLFFIGYQIYLLRKDMRQKKKGKLVVPEFKESKGPIPSSYTKIILPEKETTFKKQSVLPLIIGILILILLSLFLFINIYSSSIQKSQSSSSRISPTPIIKFVASKGIKLFDLNWLALSDIDAANLKAGQTIIIGVETVPGANDIDRARIRVNKTTWDTGDITLDFNKPSQVFFKQYVIATNAASLKIEAQLHSNIDGWLGE